MPNFKDPNKICISCMNELESFTDACPFCGFSEAQYETKPYQLQPRSILNGKYLIGRTIGEGGFGVTYVGWDLNLDIKVAIKEYYPNGIASRDNTQTTVIPYAGESAEFFNSGKEKFLSEAQKLAHFSNLPGIVCVKDFFLENNTAYIVMEFIEGETLKSYLEKFGGQMPFDQLANLLKPVIESLGVVHREGIIHRDISPDNIMIAYTGEVKLIDFGAARNLSGDKSMGIVLKPNYSPEEQYRSAGELGPWTDIYSICATIYRALTGILPQEALDRVNADQLVPPSALGVEIPQPAEQALMKGLSIRAADRYADIESFLEHFYNNVPEPQAQVTAPQAEPLSTPIPIQPNAPKKGNSFGAFLWGSVLRRTVTIAAAVILVAGISFGVYKIFNNPDAYASQAAAMLDKGNMKDAEQKYLDALNMDNSNYSALTGYGKVLYQQKDYKKALEYLNKAVSAKPQEPEAYVVRGKTQNKLFQFDEAAADFDKAISYKLTDKLKYSALVGKSSAFGNMSKFVEAKKLADEAIKLNSKDKEAYFNQGVALNGDNKPMEAITSLNKALELDAKYAQAYNMKGICYSNMSKFDEALDMYNKALSFDSKNVVYKLNSAMMMYQYFPDKKKDAEKIITDILTNSNEENDADELMCKAIAYDMLDKPSDATTYCDKALKVTKYVIDAYIVKGNIMLYGDNASSHKDEIQSLYKQALDMDATNYSGLTAMGCYYEYLVGDNTQAQTYIQKATTLLPDYYAAYVQLGEAQYFADKYKEALISFDKSIEIYPTLRAYSYEGNIYYKQSDNGNAIQCFKKAIEKGDTDATDYNYYTRSLINVGTYDEAISTCKSYLSSHGDDLRMYENLAYCYIKKSDYNSALDYIKKAIPLCKTNADLLTDKKAELVILYYGNGDIDEMKQLVNEINALQKNA